MGLSQSVNDGPIVLRSDGVGNGFVQALHVRTRFVSPEEESSLSHHVFALDSPSPLPPPAEAPHPEALVPIVEEASALVPRLRLQNLEGFAKELIEDDWDFDEALWVLAEVCRAVPELQHKAGLYRHGGRVGDFGSSTDTS